MFLDVLHLGWFHSGDLGCCLLWNRHRYRCQASLPPAFCNKSWCFLVYLLGFGAFSSREHDWVRLQRRCPRTGGLGKLEPSWALLFEGVSSRGVVGTAYEAETHLQALMFFCMLEVLLVFIIWMVVYFFASLVGFRNIWFLLVIRIILERKDF